MSLLEFAKNKLEIKTWSKMEDIFKAVEQGERKILVRSCNGAGKTTALAAICNWYFYTFPDSIVLTTASSWMQVKRNLWGEIRRQARLGKLYMDREKPLKLAETSIKLSDKHYMLGISPNIPENAMGFHAEKILVAVDEATGVDREIFDALTGNLSGADAQIVLICNPINMKSYPYDAETSGDWKVIHISAFDHPNVKEGKETIKGAVTRQWIADRLKAWSQQIEVKIENELVGINSGEANTIHEDWLDGWYRKTPIARSRILGEWADLEAEGFITMEVINKSVNVMRPEVEGSPSNDIIASSISKIHAMGVDISRGTGSDATVYAFFDGNYQLPFKETYNKDLMDTADTIKKYYNKYKAKGFELIIAIDDTGLGGGVSDKLKKENIPFYPVNFNQKAKGFLRNYQELANARAEMYFALRDELTDGSIKLLDIEKFHQELSAVRLDVGVRSVAYKMEDKSLTRKRLGRSPDYADATALARYALRLNALDKKSRLL